MVFWKYVDARVYVIKIVYCVDTSKQDLIASLLGRLLRVDLIKSVSMSVRS